MHVVRHVIPWILVPRDQLKAAIRQKLPHESQRPKLLALAARRAKVMRGDTTESRAPQRAPAPRQRPPLRSFDIHLQEIDAVDAGLRAQIVKRRPLYRVSGHARFPTAHVLRFPNLLGLY